MMVVEGRDRRDELIAISTGYREPNPEDDRHILAEIVFDRRHRADLGAARSKDIGGSSPTRRPGKPAEVIRSTVGVHEVECRNPVPRKRVLKGKDRSELVAQIETSVRVRRSAERVETSKIDLARNYVGKRESRSEIPAIGQSPDLLEHRAQAGLVRADSGRIRTVAPRI